MGRLFLFALATLTLNGVAGCGGDSESASASTPDVTTDSSAPPTDTALAPDEDARGSELPPDVVPPDATDVEVIPDSAPEDAGETGADDTTPDTREVEKPVEMGAIPLFADMFRPQNIDGSTLERWTVHGFCSPTKTDAGAFCLGGATPGHISTRLSTVGRQGLTLSYIRVPNVDGLFDEGEYFVAEWSADGQAPWHQLESSADTVGLPVSFELPPDAEGRPNLTLRFRIVADSDEGYENFWIDDVVVAATVPKCAGHEWTEQFDAPFDDVNGEFIGGSEIFRIVDHQGQLFATNTYWMDENNPWYGDGTQWGQILRKPSADAPWQEDYDLGEGVLRPEVLRSVTFTQQDPPVSMLLAATFRIQAGHYYIDVWTRDDGTGAWTLTTPHEGMAPADSHDISVRQLVVHSDTVTGLETLIVSVGTQGMLEGVYSPETLGGIAWGPLIPVGFNERAMGMSVANATVVVGGGNQLWHREDGVLPSYTMVHEMEDLVADGNLEPPMGTYRGMSTVPTPGAATESLIFDWAPDHLSPGTIYRMDPTADGYARVPETDIGDLLAAALGVPVWTSLCAYSRFLPVTHPTTGETLHIAGCLNVIGGDAYPFWTGGPGSGHYKGGVYFIRYPDAGYVLREVAGRHNGEDDPRDSVRALAVSPYGDGLYFGGHDSAGKISTNLAWMYSASLEDALETCAD